jgi:DNA-binding MarR family transcriptional regulator
MSTNSKRTTAAVADAKSILNRIRQLVRVLRAFEKEAQSKCGVGAAQIFILHVLQQESELSMNDLAERTATDQSSVSLAVGRLVDEGHVRRTTDDEDRRQVRLSLTPRGRALIRRSPPAAQEKIMDSVTGMSPSERAQLMSLLDKLMSGMGGPIVHVPMLFQDEAEETPSTRGRRKRSA